MDLRTLAQLGRFREIVTTLLKYGFDDLLRRAEIPGARLVRRAPPEGQELTTAERIRRALEDLGPTFIKFGQIMSLRPDLLPEDLVRELGKLQDEVPPQPFEELREVVDDALGRPLEEVFAEFEPVAVAGASLSQVHKAVLEDGRTVAVKVQRPRIRRKINTDLNILAALAERIHSRSEAMEVYDLPALVRVTRRTLERELDFTLEARQTRIARSFNDAGNDDAGEENRPGNGIVIPEVYEEYCGERLLVMEFIEGKRLKDFHRDSPEEGRALARVGLRSAVKQILEDGFFHADPHPGNLLVTEDGRLCVLDWGMVGRLTREDRRELVALIKAVVDKNSEALVDALVQLTGGTARLDRRSLERELLYILDTYHAVPLAQLNLGHLLLDIVGLLRDYRLRLPPDLVTMIKALITAEGSARQIYPELNVVAEAEESVVRLARERYKPATLWRDFRTTLRHLLLAQRELPRRLAEIAARIERGDLSIRFEHHNLGSLRESIEHALNRLTLGVVLAAMIIGSTMIITTGVEPLLFGYPALGLVGYAIAGMLGLWLVVSILRSRRY